jgi:hypothetical protein
MELASVDEKWGNYGCCEWRAFFSPSDSNSDAATSYRVIACCEREYSNELRLARPGLTLGLNPKLVFCSIRITLPLKGTPLKTCIPLLGTTRRRQRWSVIGTILRLVVSIPIFLFFIVFCTSPRTPTTTAFVPHYKTVPVPTPYGYK